MNKPTSLQPIENSKIVKPMIPSVQELPYVEKRTNKKTGAVVETAVSPDGAVAKRISTESGGRIDKLIVAPEYISREERNRSIKDFAKNGVNQTENALVHGVSQSTVSLVTGKSKKSYPY